MSILSDGVIRDLSTADSSCRDERLELLHASIGIGVRNLSSPEFLVHYSRTEETIPIFSVVPWISITKYCIG